MRIVACWVIAAGLVACAQARADDKWVTYGCDTRPRTADEAKSLKSSPHGAWRPSRYELRVRWAKGVHVFKDKPPYGQELGDSWFAYCGTVAWSGMRLHLIGMTVGDTFTGELMDDATGKVMAAGEMVRFSPDGQFYAATEQPDGLDGDTAMLYTRDGKLLWKGYDGVLSADGTMIVARFDGTMQNLNFDANGRLFGLDDTKGQPRQEFVLTEQADQSWKWVASTAKPPAPVENHGLRVPAAP